MSGAETSPTPLAVPAVDAVRPLGDHPDPTLLHSLGERVKELTALYNAGEVLRHEDRPLSEWLRELADLLPPAWQYPEITAGRVRVGDEAWQTAGFHRTPWVQRAEFVTPGGVSGEIEVAYLEQRPDEAEGPFLAEERNLINGLAEMLRSALSRRSAQESLRESESRARKLLHQLGERVKELTALYRAAKLLDRDELPLRDWLAGIASLLTPAWQYPEVTEGRVQLGDLRAATPRYRPSPWTQEALFTTADGTQGTIEVVYLDERPREAEGPFLAEERNLINALSEMLCSAINRRAARQRLYETHERVRDLAGRLITTQDSERARIARELHDDLNQRLAALSLGLSSLKRCVPAEHQPGFAAVQKDAAELADEIRGLSHRLHPGVLRHTGLAPALRALCTEMSRREPPLPINFQAQASLPRMPEQTALCLYRVAQESLLNTVRHAEARHASLSIDAAAGAARLTIRDDGRGFDPAQPAGMGLLSMHERVRLVHGSLRRCAALGRGTEIHVEVPLGATRDETPAISPGR